MSTGIIATALVWGVVSGYLLIRTTASLAGFGFCLHALITARWRHLAGKATVNQVSPGTVLRLMFQLTLLAVLCGLLLYYGYGFTRESGFAYGGPGAILYLAVACATVLVRLPATRRRVTFYWRMSHEVDFAQRRERTILLKS